jgi:hypothetical protein
MLTAVGLTPGCSCTVHIYTQTIHRAAQFIWEECGPCPRLCELYPGICLTTGEKAQKNLSDVDVSDKGLVEQEISCSSFMTGTVLPLSRTYELAKSAFV